MQGSAHTQMGIWPFQARCGPPRTGAGWVGLCQVDGLTTRETTADWVKSSVASLTTRSTLKHSDPDPGIRRSWEIGPRQGLTHPTELGKLITDSNHFPQH